MSATSSSCWQIPVYILGSWMQALLLRGGTCTQLIWSIDVMSAHLFAKTCAGGLYLHWSKDCTQSEKGLKPGIYTNRICGEGEVAVSAITLDALSFDSLPSSNKTTCNFVISKCWTSAKM